MRAALQKFGNVGSVEPCRKVACQVCDEIIITKISTTKVRGELLKIQN